MSRTYWNFYSAGRIVFGCEAVNELEHLIRRLGCRRPLIVTDRTLVQVGVIDTVQKPLARAGVDAVIFDGGKAEPEIQVAIDAGVFARECQPDAVIGVGGGSNMDLSKIVAAMLTHGGEPADYFGFDNVPGPVMPLICVPTTSGTGSEVSHAAVLTDTVNKIKVSTLSQYLRPTAAIVDPMLTLTCPPQATADSGIDALTHAIEAMTATGYSQLKVPAGEAWPYDGCHPLGECLAEKAISLIGQHLVAAVQSPDDIAARTGMSLAATLAGMAFSNCGVAVVHALEYPIGGAVHCSHGLGNGLLLPYVMQFNLPEREAAMRRIAQLLTGDAGPKEPSQAIDAVGQLRKAIGIPHRLREIGVTKDQLPEFAEKAFAIKRLMLLNGREPSLHDLRGILDAAY